MIFLWLPSPLKNSSLIPSTIVYHPRLDPKNSSVLTQRKFSRFKRKVRHFNSSISAAGLSTRGALKISQYGVSRKTASSHRVVTFRAIVAKVLMRRALHSLIRRWRWWSRRAKTHRTFQRLTSMSRRTTNAATMAVHRRRATLRIRTMRRRLWLRAWQHATVQMCAIRTGHRGLGSRLCGQICWRTRMYEVMRSWTHQSSTTQTLLKAKILSLMPRANL